MRLPTLEEFLATPGAWPTSSWVTHPGWHEMYVRKGGRYINGQLYRPTLTLANITAEKPGQGTCTNFLAWFDEHYGWPVVVESIMNHLFYNWLIRMGFEPLPDNFSTLYRMSLKDLTHEAGQQS